MGPNFIIIGAQKAGTSGLFKTLSQHSNIIQSTRKEVHYFDNDSWYANDRIEEYHAFFPTENQSGDKVFFEATPIYLFHPEVAFRLSKYNPNLKLIILLRNPVLRAFSAWTMYHHHFYNMPNRSHLWEPLSFREAVLNEINNINTQTYYDNMRAYVKRGIYHYQIERYLKYFSSNQILFIENTDILNMKHDTSKRIQNFLEIPYEVLPTIEANLAKVDEKNSYSETLKILQNFYQPFNENLFQLLGVQYDWNRIN